ncbi:MAG: hypothetical protein R3297_07550, partial [Desulfobulbales bacterium]|nr:hypothetical protein [Desulfobulbales bacterium]
HTWGHRIIGQWFFEKIKRKYLPPGPDTGYWKGKNGNPVKSLLRRSRAPKKICFQLLLVSLTECNC